MRIKEVETISKKNIINKNEWRVVGMSRSGNHAIINWLVQQLQGKYCFLNCAEPRTNPFTSARPLHENTSYQVNYSNFNLEEEKQGSFTQKDYLIHSYEDSFLSMLHNKGFEENHDSYLGHSYKRVDILILRDPFNLFASRIRSGIHGRQKGLADKAVTPLTARRIWKQHAREALGEKKHLKNNKIVILYNLWASSQQYRKEIAEALNLNFTDSGFHEVSKVAGGSSFDGLKYKSNASGMQVLDRWKHYIDDPEYKVIFDEELIALSHKVFGYVPDEELLLKIK